MKIHQILGFHKDFQRLFENFSILRTRDLENYPTNRAQTAGLASTDALVSAKHFLPHQKSRFGVEKRQEKKKEPKNVEIHWFFDPPSGIMRYIE